MKVWWTLLVACGGALLSAGCVALPEKRGAVTPQRPTFSSDTSTTARDTVEVEVGISIDPRDSFDSPATLKFGLSPNSEVFLGWSPYVWIDSPGRDGRGIGDMIVGTRHRFAEEADDWPSGAFQLSAKVPTADDREGGTEEVDFFAAGIASKSFPSFSVTAFYQLGIIGDPTAADTDLEHGMAIAASTPIDENWSVFGEFAAIWIHEQNNEELLATVGTTFALSDSHIFDAASS